MDTRVANISIEMQGGFELDSKLPIEIQEKDIIDSLIKELTFRRDSIGIKRISQKIKFQHLTDNIQFKHITQEIELIF